MRGFVLSSIFFISLMITLYAVSKILHGLDPLPHPSYDVGVRAGATAARELGVADLNCSMDINTYYRLDLLDLPEVRPCST
jgi:hypothetical protein